MALWAVVPVKGLATGKRRLASLLARPERAELAVALLGDVLAALQQTPAVHRILVVSPDAAALAVAERLGAAPLAEPPLPAVDDAVLADDAGLNAALDYAARVATAGGATALLTLPADLPLVTPADVAAVVAAPPPSPSIVLVPTADGGTGALLRQPPLALPACFGPESLRAHLQSAALRGVRARVLWRRNLSLDVDRPADVERLAALPGHSQTQALLVAWHVAGRWQPSVPAGLAPPGRRVT